MGLTATLSAGLDCRSLATALVGQLQTHGGALGTVAIPLDAGSLRAVTHASGGVNSTPVAAAVAQLAGQIPAALSALPAVDAVVQPLTAIVGLAGQIAANDVPTLFDQVIARTRDVLTPPAGGGHAAMLLRVAEVLTAAPEGQALRQLAAALLPAIGPMFDAGRAGIFPFLDVLRGVEGATQVLGGLMCLETVLAEAERLAGLLSVRLDPAAIADRQAALSAALGDGATALAARVAAVDAADDLALGAIVSEVIAVARTLGELREALAVGLATDEATLAYLDVETLQAEVDAARAMIRTADAAPARRATEALAALIQPLLAFELPGTPAGGVSALLDIVEAQVAGVAAQVDAIDLGFITDPLAAALRTATQPLCELQALIDRVLLALRRTLDQIRAVVAALPLDELAQSIRQFLAPVAQALDAVAELIAHTEAALQTAADAAAAALGQIDGALDGFKGDIDAFFGTAQNAVEQVDLDAAMAGVAQKIQEFADLLAQAQMKPIFDGAVGAIDTAAGVVGAVPFDLLPESMKSDVDALVQPIKAVDADAVEVEIETALGIGADGKFALRGDLDAAIETVHEKFQALLDAVEQRNPRVLLAELDEALDELATQVREIEPDLTLQPVREAIDSVRGAIEGIDLDALLQPVRVAFAQITGALDQLTVAQAIAPLQQQIDEARQAVIAALRLDQWEAALNDLRTQALALLERADPQQLQAPIEAALGELRDTLARFPAAQAGVGLGVVVAGLLGASGRRIQSSSFSVVLAWLGGGSSAAGTALAAHSAGFAASLANAAVRVEAADPAAAGALLNARLAALGAAVQGLSGRVSAGSEAQLTLTAVRPALDGASIFGELSSHRERYRALLNDAVSLADGFKLGGFSEVDAGAAALRQAVEPMEPARAKVRQLFAAVGLAEGELSVAGVINRLLAAAPPERLVGLVMPIFEALHRRAENLLDAVIVPLRAATTDLRDLLAAVDLAPLVEAADGIVAQARAEIEALSPDHLLAEPLQSFADLRSAIVDHDPLDGISAILANLKELIARVLEKLDLEHLLEVPLEIYEHLFGEIRRLDPRGLLTPVFDQIDVIASQVDTGLADTVASFKRLQDALPAGGGSSVSVSVTT